MLRRRATGDKPLSGGFLQTIGPCHTRLCRSERAATRLARDDDLKNSIALKGLIASKLGSYRDHVRPLSASAFQFIPSQFGSAREMNGT